MSELENKVNEQNPNVNPIPEKEKSAKELEREKVEAATKAFEEKGGKVENLNKKINASKPPKRKRPRTGKGTGKGTGISSKPIGTATGHSGTQSAWANLKAGGKTIKVGQRIDWIESFGKPSKPVHAVVANSGSMECYLFVDGKQIKNVPKPFGITGTTFDGVVALQAYVQGKLCGKDKMKEKIRLANDELSKLKKGETFKPKFITKSKQVFTCKVCDGWDAWRIGNKTVHQLYQNR